MNFDEMTTADLRRMVREKGLATGMAVAGARKSDLVSLLMGNVTELPNVPSMAPSGDLADMLANALRGKMGASIDAEQVEGIVKDFAEGPEFAALVRRVAPGVTYHNVSIDKGPEVKLEEHTHQCFERCLRLVATGLPVLLVGPAGTGKTTLARQIAKALGRRYSFNSMSAGVTEGQLVGRVIPDASGAFTFVHAPFAKTYRDGGVHLFDEIDAADANLMTFLNAAISNGHLSIPQNGEVIERHADTAIICAANTYGTGATRQYVGRNQLDAATLDRFAASTVFVGYDRALEKKIAEGILGDKADTVLVPCWRVREAIERHSLRRIMSSRTIFSLSKLAASGENVAEAMKDSYFAGWTSDELVRVQ